MNKFNYARPIWHLKECPTRFGLQKVLKSSAHNYSPVQGEEFNQLPVESVDQFTGACWDMKFQHESQSCRNHLNLNITCLTVARPWNWIDKRLHNVVVVT